MNYEDKVVPATVQTLVHKRKKFIAYAPYFTHHIVKKGKTCNECHGTEAAKKIRKGEKVTMFDFKDGKPVHFNGVIPVVPNKLEWMFLDKVKNKWTPIQDGKKPTIQFAEYGKPLTQRQVILLSKNKKQLEGMVKYKKNK